MAIRKVSLEDHGKLQGVFSALIGEQGASEPDSIILDFFSGSCTTAHAVLELNKQDGGNRKFIMVQLPEPCDEKSEAYKAGYKTIADIGKERIRRVIKKLAGDSEPRIDTDQHGSNERKDLTVSAVDRQNILNNPYALQEIEKSAEIKGILFEGRRVVLKEQVAAFFEVDIRTINNYLDRYSAELRQNG